MKAIGGDLGYAPPVGGVIAYEKQISMSGVGFGRGNTLPPSCLQQFPVDFDSAPAPTRAITRGDVNS